MVDAVATIEQIRRHGLENACDETYVVPEDFPVGQYLPQGDINILRLAAVPDGMVPSLPCAQLAPGTSRVSRHCIKAEDLQHCEFYVFLDANPLEGPVIVLKQPVTIEHPEHRNYVWPAGVIAIGYQRRYAQEFRRVQD
jgi:hypothetical protein